MWRIFKKRNTILLTAICALALFPMQLEARTAFPNRNDTGEIEDPTIVIQSQLQLYQKYVLTGISDIKSVTNLDKLISNSTVLKEAQEAVKWVDDGISTATSGIDKEIKSALDDIDDVFNNAAKSTSKTTTSSLDSLWSSIFGTSSSSSSSSSVSDAISSGSSGSTKLAGESGTLTEIRNKSGMSQAAVTAMYRTSQAAKILAEEAVESGDEQAQAVGAAAAYIYSTLPMIKSELRDQHTGDLSDVIGAYRRQDQEEYFVFLSNAAMAAPVSEIGTLLDKYFNEESSYSADKLLASQNEKVTTLDDNNDFGEGISAETMAAGQMANMIKEQQISANQWEAINEVAADSIKVGSLRAGMTSASMTLAMIDYTSELQLSAFYTGEPEDDDDDDD